MSDLQDAYKAFENATAAGDHAAAKEIATAIQSLQAEMREDKPLGNPLAALTIVPDHPVSPEEGKNNLQKFKDWFSMQAPKPTSAGELAGSTAGGMSAGAAMGAALPPLLKGAGKVLPGGLGTAVSATGHALGAIPAKERALRGAGGGAAMGLLEETGQALGLPGAATTTASLAGGLAGEATASFLQKESKQLLGAVAQLAHGNLSGVAYAIKGMASPNKELNTAAAVKLQRQLFGDKLDSHIDNLIGSDNRVALQEALRKADPSLMPKPGPFKPSQAPTGSGGPAPLGSGRELAPLGSPPEAPFTPGGSLGTPPKPGTGAGAEAIRARQTAAANSQIDPKQGLLDASAIYRDRMFSGVTQAVERGEAFSATPEFRGLKNSLQVPLAQGAISKGEYNLLLKRLSNDRNPNPDVRQAFAKDVDNVIREWGKPGERGGQTGAAAIPAAVAKDIREAVRSAYNGYTEKIGLGQIERQYRDTYSKEMIAQAKDELPHYLFGFGTKEGFDKLSRNLANDPQGKEFLQKTLMQHLAQQEPKAIVSTFEKSQRALVNAGLLTPTQLRGIRLAADRVAEVAESGPKVAAAQRMKQMILMGAMQTAGAAGGSDAMAPSRE